jgi:hypothetical protein
MPQRKKGEISRKKAHKRHKKEASFFVPFVPFCGLSPLLRFCCSRLTEGFGLQGQLGFLFSGLSVFFGRILSNGGFQIVDGLA